MEAGGDIPLPPLRDELQLLEAARDGDGGTGYLIFDPVRHKYFRIGVEAANVLGKWSTGSAAVLIESAKRAGADISPEDVMAVLRFVSLNNLTVQAEGGAAGLMALRGRMKQSLFSKAVHSYLFFKIPLVHPQTEDYWGNVNPIGPRGVYDEAKRFAEAMTMAYHRYHGVETRIVRIFNTYGPRMRLDDGRALPAFVSQALRGEDITVFGDGSQTRSFCYVDDLIDGIFKLLLSDETLPVNIGNPDEISIKEFAEEVIELTGSKSKIIYKELPVDDPKVRRPDISKAKRILGWEPKVSRREGLIKTIEYFKSKI